MKALPLCDGAAFLTKFKRLFSTAEGAGETRVLGVRAQGNVIPVSYTHLVVGEQAGVPVFTLGTEKPELIAQKAMAYAKDHGNDIVILDTAGRLQIDDQLMDELVRIKQAVEVDETQMCIRDRPRLIPAAKAIQ